MNDDRRGGSVPRVKIEANSFECPPPPSNEIVSTVESFDRPARFLSEKRGPLSRTFCWESGIKCFEEPVVPPFVELLQVFAVKARYRCSPRIYLYKYTKRSI